jgi:hypothetical protein
MKTDLLFGMGMYWDDFFGYINELVAIQPLHLKETI